MQEGIKSANVMIDENQKWVLDCALSCYRRVLYEKRYKRGVDKDAVDRRIHKVIELKEYLDNALFGEEE